MANGLQEALLERLIADGLEGAPMVWMVLAAAESAEALDEVLADGTRTRPLPERRPVEAEGDVARVYLRDVEVRSFRGVGPQSRLQFDVGPGVTLVEGRNGSGKSSFAEAVEVAFTGTSQRWSGKGSKEWTKGWRNVHATHAPRIVVRMVQEGLGQSQVERTWADPGNLDSGRSVYTGHDGQAVDLRQSAWAAALESYRPFLSYSELGDMLADGPGRVYQALLAGLGLEGYEAARKRLSEAINVRKKLVRESKDRAKALMATARTLAEAHPDEARFALAAELLGRRTQDLDALAALAADGTSADETSHLVAVASDTPPFSREQVTEAADALARAVDELAAVRDDASGRANDVARLLELALECASRQTFTSCPVCGEPRPLDDAWRTAATAAVEQSRTRAAQARAVEARVAEARGRLDAMTRDVPACIVRAADATWAPAVELRERWRSWLSAQPPDDAARIAYIAEHGPAMADAFAGLQAAAEEELRRRQDVWRPFATELAGWVVDAQAAARGKSVLSDLERARDWMANELVRHRDERFAPIKREAIDCWNRIGRHSSVVLTDIELSGTGTQQRVTLRVQVDGTDAPALGVMSQGELNAMTLSLFLPRVQLPQSPFGFVIVDDPVQAMDTARVDGLAEVLARVGQTRQVIVFTHDDRLASSFRMLGLPCRLRRVTRRQDSHIVAGPGAGPIDYHLGNANAVVRAEGVPEHLSARVVPGFCRLALEAAASEALRRQWLGSGTPHDEVDRRLAGKGLTELLAWLYFGTPARRNDVAERLGRLNVPEAAAIVHDCQAGTHARFTGDPAELVRRTEQLCKALLKQAAATVVA